MGMLDDAIREHLGLKRLRGADPAEVAREEHDALGPVRREADLLAGDEASVDSADETPVGGSALSLERPEPELPAPGAGQETAEIDMEEELAGEPQAAESHSAPAGGRATPVGHPAHTQPSSGESLEWEMPDDRAKGDGGEIKAGGERSASDEQVEDVLEETPDFLRETPEQERLWFEQRPPRDFDFNE